LLNILCQQQCKVNISSSKATGFAVEDLTFH